MFHVSSYSVPKDKDHPSENADRVGFRPDIGIAVICDGAGSTFGSSIWSEILCKRFLDSEESDFLWLHRAIRDFNCHYAAESLTWNEQAALDRGSYAALLGVEVSATELSMICVGDCMLAMAEYGKVVSTFPFSEIGEFPDYPSLLSTLPEMNRKGRLAVRVRQWRRPKADRVKLFLMTDALGRWLVTDPERRGGMLDLVETDADFTRLVLREREKANLELDDTTLMTLLW